MAQEFNTELSLSPHSSPSPSRAPLDVQNVNPSLSPASASSPASKRQKMEAHLNDAAASSSSGHKSHESAVGDTNASNNNNNNNKFECAVCLQTPRDPVATGCGHLFCWYCLFRCRKTNKDCPVCRGRVTEKKIFPLYVGRNCANDEEYLRNEGIPPRPPAQRRRNSREPAPPRALRRRTRTSLLQQQQQQQQPQIFIQQRPVNINIGLQQQQPLAASNNLIRSQLPGTGQAQLQSVSFFHVDDAMRLRIPQMAAAMGMQNAYALYSNIPLHTMGNVSAGAGLLQREARAHSHGEAITINYALNRSAGLVHRAEARPRPQPQGFPLMEFRGYSSSPHNHQHAQALEYGRNSIVNELYSSNYIVVAEPGMPAAPSSTQYSHIASPS